MARTKLSQSRQAAILLRHLLQDGEWHDGKDVRETVVQTVGCGYVIVINTLWAIGGLVENHGSGGSRWRLPEDAPSRLPDWDGKENPRLARDRARLANLRRQADELEASISVHNARKASHATAGS